MNTFQGFGLLSGTKKTDFHTRGILLEHTHDTRMSFDGDDLV